MWGTRCTYDSSTLATVVLSVPEAEGYPTDRTSTSGEQPPGPSQRENQTHWLNQTHSNTSVHNDRCGEHDAHTTLPHLRQWCFLCQKLKATPQIGHSDTPQIPSSHPPPVVDLTDDDPVLSSSTSTAAAAATTRTRHGMRWL
jgi:hypothetical protein